jgi:hypothetical protein
MQVVNAPSAALIDALQSETDRPLPFAVAAFVDAATTRFGAPVAAILFYGSCRRIDQPDGLYDLYVILDDYRSLPRGEALLAAVLPPNVYYLEAVTSSGTRRAKCTVISRADFARGVARWFHSYLWGRFCQPVSLAYTRDATIRAEMLTGLGQAVTKFLAEALCLQAAEFDTRTLWIDGLRTSYSTELRSEGPDRAAELFAAHADFYDAVTGAVAPALGLVAAGSGRWRCAFASRRRRNAIRAWRIRGVSGKFLALARILKAAITFDGGLDYIVWKLERHSGRHIEVPDRVRRRPALHMWSFFWRLYREGVFR